MSRYKYEKEFIFGQRTQDDAKRFLKDTHNLDLAQVLDQKSNNCLHQCAFQGSLQLMKVYVDYQRRYFRDNPLIQADSYERRPRDKKQASESQINFRLKEWVNSKNNQGFTPSHYSAYKGFIDILDYLSDLGADHQIKTKSGLGILHLAAQGDQIKTFIYYRNKISIQDLDARDSTPLHWAAYSGSEKVTEYLLAERAHSFTKNTQKSSRNKQSKKNPLDEELSDWINAQDIEKQTALHLATGLGYTKIVRRLLIAGANRHIRNNQNMQPLEIAQENEFINIEQFLNDNYTWLDYVKFFMNIKIKYEPRKKSLLMPLVFLALALLIVGTINYALDFKTEYNYILWIQNVMFGVLIIFYVTLIFHSPKLERGSYTDLMRSWLNKQQKIITESMKQSEHTFINSSTAKAHSRNIKLQCVCFRCVQYKPSRSYHCDVCNTCITQYDHHCPWINNCVGKHNFGRFIMFIILLFLTLNWIFIISIHFILQLIKDENDTLGIFVLRNGFKDNPSIMYIFVIITILLFTIFAVPLLLLIGVHLRNLYYGKTTYERFSKANQSLLIKSEQASRTFSGISTLDSSKKRHSCFEMCITRNDDQKLLPQ